MKYSVEALKVFSLIERQSIKTSAQFWKQFPNKKTLNCVITENAESLNSALSSTLSSLSAQGVDGFICAFDDCFPKVNEKVIFSQKPFLLFYKGNIDLLNEQLKVAVIGEINPSDDVKKREEKIVHSLMSSCAVIVSGLAPGCDEISHRYCVEKQGKTIAILPSTIGKIIPAENSSLAQQIVSSGGLLLTEYYREPDNRFEQTNRYIMRDRLQALFSNAVVMIASYRKDEGDSGSRHAMECAKKYGIERYVMYNEKFDMANPAFGLNKDYVEKENVEPITGNIILKICNPAFQTSLF